MGYNSDLKLARPRCHFEKMKKYNLHILHVYRYPYLDLLGMIWNDPQMVGSWDDLSLGFVNVYES